MSLEMIDLFCIGIATLLTLAVLLICAAELVRE